MTQHEQEEDMVLFTVYAMRVHGATRIVDVTQLWGILAVETPLFSGFPSFFDCLTRLRHRGVIELKYPRNRTQLLLTHDGLEQAGESYHRRLKLNE